MSYANIEAMNCKSHCVDHNKSCGLKHIP